MQKKSKEIASGNCACKRNQEGKLHLQWFPGKKAVIFRKFIDWEAELLILSTSQHIDYNENEEVLVLQKNATVSRNKKGWRCLLDTAFPISWFGAFQNNF